MRYILNGRNWDLSSDSSISNLMIQHIIQVGISLIFGLAIAFPIALLISRYQRLYTPVLTTASIIYTIPGIVLSTVILPFTGLNSVTIIIPLIAYSQLVLIRNIVAAFRSIDPALIDIGRAVGMNTFQLQTKVILPISLPVIIAGIRITVVTSIGIASIGQLVGASNLGSLIFEGFSIAQRDEVVAGAILVSALAIVADLGLLGIQQIFSRGNTAVAAQ